MIVALAVVVAFTDFPRMSGEGEIVNVNSLDFSTIFPSFVVQHLLESNR